MSLGVFSNLQSQHPSQCAECLQQAQYFSHHDGDALFSDWRNDPAQAQIPHVDWQTARLLQQLVQIRLSFSKTPLRILEIGSAAGFSTTFLLQGVLSSYPTATSEIILDCIEHNQERLQLLVGHWQKISTQLMNLQTRLPQLNAHQGDVLSFFKAPSTLLSQKWDFIFIDAMKKHYWNYFQTLQTQLNPQGLLIFDNLFLSGRTFHPPNQSSDLLPTHQKALAAMQLFLQKMQSSEVKKMGSWQIMVIGDGLGIFTKAPSSVL